MSSKLPNVLGSVSIVVVVAAVAIGFWIVGSPIQARKHVLDERRSEAIGNIRIAVQSYFRAKGKLPVSLSKLDAPYQDRQDPSTGRDLDYAVTGERSYRVCADFETDTTHETRYEYYQPDSVDYYKHAKGHFCYDLEVKPTNK